MTQVSTHVEQPQPRLFGTRAEILTQLAPQFIGRCYRIERSTGSLRLVDWHGIERELAPHLGDGEVRRDGIGYADGILHFTDEQLCWLDLTFDFY
jgi:hypothetical protein